LEDGDSIADKHSHRISYDTRSIELHGVIKIAHGL